MGRRPGRSCGTARDARTQHQPPAGIASRASPGNVMLPGCRMQRRIDAPRSRCPTSIALTRLRWAKATRAASATGSGSSGRVLSPQWFCNNGSYDRRPGRFILEAGEPRPRVAADELPDGETYPGGSPPDGLDRFDLTGVGSKASSRSQTQLAFREPLSASAPVPECREQPSSLPTPGALSPGGGERAGGSTAAGQSAHLGAQRMDPAATMAAPHRNMT
eukprot:ctg_266.g123